MTQSAQTPAWLSKVEPFGFKTENSNTLDGSHDKNVVQQKFASIQTNPKEWENLLNGVLVATALAVLVRHFLSIKEEYESSENSEDAVEKEKYYADIRQTIMLMGLLLWPILWSKLVGYQMLLENPVTLIAFAWPLVLFTLELMSKGNSAKDPRTVMDIGFGNIKADAAALVAVTYAVGELYAARFDVSNHERAAPHLFYTLLVCAMLIIVTPPFEVGAEKVVADNLQRLAFHFATGFLCTSITLNFTKK